MKHEMCIYVFLILKDIYCHLKKHMYVTQFYFCVYMSFKKKIVFICRIKKIYVFICRIKKIYVFICRIKKNCVFTCHLILNDIYIQA